MQEISIIIPVFNESASLAKRLKTIQEKIEDVEGVRFCFIVVNDGSTDDTLECLQDFAEAESRTEVISFTRNFGKESAILAGLKHVRGDAAIVIDSDLQHPPEMIPAMVNLWRQGVDVVEACKKSRGRESLGRKMLSKGFYKVFGLMAGRDIKDHSDFKLLDKKVVQAYCSLPERRRFFRGLVSWMGYSSAIMYFDVPERTRGSSGWSRLNLFRLSVDALTGFTSAPLYLINILGGACLLLGLIIGGMAVYDKFTGQAVSGFTTVILLILILGGVIMFGLGLMGIYLAQIFKEVKQRPHYILDKKKSRVREHE